MKGNTDMKKLIFGIAALVAASLFADANKVIIGFNPGEYKDVSADAYLGVVLGKDFSLKFSDTGAPLDASGKVAEESACKVYALVSFASIKDEATINIQVDGAEFAKYGYVSVVAFEGEGLKLVDGKLVGKLVKALEVARTAAGTEAVAANAALAGVGGEAGVIEVLTLKEAVEIPVVTLSVEKGEVVVENAQAGVTYTLKSSDTLEGLDQGEESVGVATDGKVKFKFDANKGTRFFKVIGK